MESSRKFRWGVLVFMTAFLLIEVVSYYQFNQQMRVRAKLVEEMQIHAKQDQETFRAMVERMRSMEVELKKCLSCPKRKEEK